MCWQNKNWLTNFLKIQPSITISLESFWTSVCQNIHIRVYESRFLTFQKSLFLLSNESSLKTMKNAFYFLLKIVFVLKIFKFLIFTFLVKWENGLMRKLRLISKFMTLLSGKQAIVIHVLSNIPRCKGNQTMKFGQLIEYNVTQFFLQKWCWKWGSETNSRPIFAF